ncbi:MAG TPA: N-acetyltransferase [Erwinia sp.]|uniref:GNAT family N-acetyltransferase n=1 Tax=Erwinia citreus TaxID=558 RepID=UPI000E9E1959|nr:GNAT family N-acetyltransferase [Erwinia sp.]HBV38427.1 N-acetyltransferase [Erwinia sp.]
MKIIVTDNPALQDEEFVIDNLWKHNSQFDEVDITPLFLTLRNEQNHILGGLVARTWWQGLEVQYLWVGEDARGQGKGRELMLKAEEVARDRGCRMAYVDTFDFQAKGFYEKLGYSVYGNMEGYLGKHTRFYLQKIFA